MSENIDGGSAETTAAPESGDIDAQVAEMRTAEAEEPKKPEPEAPAEPEAPEVKKVVPLAALHEERRERQRLQAQIAERDRIHAEQMARINQRLEILTPKQQAPDPAVDGVGYIDHRITELANTIQPVIQNQQKAMEQEQQARAVQQVSGVLSRIEAEFTAKNPDFPDAFHHLNATRARELMVFGMPEEQAKAQAVQELSQAAFQWTAQGQNAAQIAYEFAKARGYQAKQQTPADKIAAQQKGTAAARSLGGGGAASPGKLTAEALANMSEEEFSKLTDSQFRQAMGG